MSLEASMGGRESDERFTPSWIFDALGEQFDLDVAHPDMPTSSPAARYYTKEQDGLASPWDGFVFCNPPYSDVTPWADRFLAHGDGVWLALTVKAKWWLRILNESDLVWFIDRVEFQQPNGRGKQVGVPVCMAAMGERGVAALRRAATRHPGKGVLMLSTHPIEQESAGAG